MEKAHNKMKVEKVEKVEGRGKQTGEKKTKRDWKITAGPVEKM
jgi:hypothetical protein